MTPPDAVVTRKHRELALDMLSHWRGEFEHECCAVWVEHGDDEYVAHNLVLELQTAAQSLANLEAAVRREYSKLEQHHATLLEAAQHVVESDNADRIAAIFLLKHTLETLKNA